LPAKIKALRYRKQDLSKRMPKKQRIRSQQKKNAHPSNNGDRRQRPQKRVPYGVVKEKLERGTFL